MQELGLLEKIKAGSDYFEVVEWPGVDGAKVGIRIANEQDFSEAGRAADVYYKEIALNTGNIGDYTSEKSTQLLFRCIIDPATKKQVFSSILEFRKVLTPEIKEFLDTKLDEIHEKYSPKNENMGDVEIDKMIESLKKNCPQNIGSISSLHEAKQLITSLVSQLTD